MVLSDRHTYTHLGTHTHARARDIRGISPSQSLYVYNIQHSQETTAHAAGAIRTRNRSKLAAAGLRLKATATLEPETTQHNSQDRLQTRK